MTSIEASPLRSAMRLREAGDLPGAVMLLRDRSDPRDPQAGLLLLRYLFELQDYGALQQVTQAALDSLDAGYAAEAGTPYLATLLRFAERCCLAPEAIEAALATTAAAARQAPDLMLAWRAATHRQRHRQRLAERFEGGASLISLGLNCLPWHLPGRWGLRRKPDFTALFGPFSLAGHTIPGVLAALEDDFASFCTPETMRLVRTQRGHDLAMRRDRTAHWNHNRGAYWLREDAAPLRASMAAKADLFRAACRRPDAVFLLGTCPVQYPDEPLDFLPRLDAALARFTGRSGNRIVISNQTAKRRAAGLHRVDATTRYISCPYPAADYVWHDDDVADSREGLLFERDYTLYLVRSLVQWGLLRHRPEAAKAPDIPVEAAPPAPASAPAMGPARQPSAEQRLRRLFTNDDYAGFQTLLAATIAEMTDNPDLAASSANFLLRFSERACMDPALIETLLGRLRLRAEADAGLRPVWRAVARRQVFRRRLRHRLSHPLTLISLGLHCLPWTLVNRWGFRAAAQFPALYNPFCLALHKAATVAEAITSDFAGYTDPAALRQATAPRGRVIAMRRDGGAVWNHHGGPAWLDNDYAGLRATMQTKAEAFRRACQAPGAVFLMGDCRIEDPAAPIAFLPKLREALHQATGQPRSRLILTSQSRNGAPVERDDALTWLDADTAFIAAPYPHPRYVWSDDDTADSEEGLEWEGRYARELERCLLRWGMVRPEEHP